MVSSGPRVIALPEAKHGLSPSLRSEEGGRFGFDHFDLGLSYLLIPFRQRGLQRNRLTTPSATEHSLPTTSLKKPSSWYTVAKKKSFHLPLRRTLSVDCLRARH